MKLKIFVPEWRGEEVLKTKCVPFLYPFTSYDQSQQQRVANYGNWINDVDLNTTIADCDIVMPAYYVNDYYKQNNQASLFEHNAKAVTHNKLTVCWTKGDLEITPPLQNFHLFRNGGYLSRNKGNDFVFPPFFADPIDKFLGGEVLIHQQKTEKPIVGFCGQGKATISKWLVDIVRNTTRSVKKKFGKWIFDLEVNTSTTVERSHMLDRMERSDKVVANFIRHTRYRAGVRTKEDKEKSAQPYFKNMQESQYILCYRGAGNFSLRLYETLACARIPLIVLSDNNLPYPAIINWNQFPVIDKKQSKNIDSFLADYHASLSNNQFVQLQKTARKIFDDHISYTGFMTTFMKQYTDFTLKQ
jgi:hypothetical protein